MSAEPLKVYSSNYPLHYFAQRIGGDVIAAKFIIPNNIDPAFWQPTTEDIQTLQQADLILLNGAGYEKWLANVSLPRRKLVNTSKAFQSEFLQVKQTTTHSHGYDGEHSHHGTAFTTWMDLSQAIQQAQAIYRALKKKKPEHSYVLEKNYTQLKVDLITLDKQWQTIFQAVQDKTLLASHPVYQYLARRYQLSIQAFQWEPDTFPDEQEWHALVSQNNESPFAYMLWEDEPLVKTKERLKELGITVIVFAPAGNQSKQGDWLGVMKNNTIALKQALNRSAE